MRIYDKSEKTQNAAGTWGTTGQKIKKVQRNGETLEIESQLISEHSMEIFLNEQKIMRMVCSKEYLPYLVLGRLICEGIIESANCIDSISICESGLQARVLADLELPLQKEMDLQKSCCTQNENYVTSQIALRKIESNTGPGAILRPDEIFKMIESFTADKEVHRTTGGTHSSYLFYDGKLEFSCEDIGRHNAFDKVVGYLYAKNLAPDRAAIFTTGRVPVDMAQKAIRACVPTLVSKAVPTLEAVALAKDFGLTLICRAWPDSYEMYS